MLNSALLLAVSMVGADAAAATSSEMAKQARKFFENIIDLKVEKGLLVVHQTLGAAVENNFHNQVRAAFPNMGTVRVRHSNGSSSMSGGSGGSVNLSFGVGGNASSLSFELQSPDGTESMRLTQAAPGSLTLDYSSGTATVSYAQEKGKCQLKIKARAGRVSTTRKSFDELFAENPEVAQAHFIGLLEAFFDKVPFEAVAEAPPGKVVFRLQDGARLIGELQGASVRLETAYGALELPWTDIRRILWVNDKPAETVVTTARFAPKGRLELEAFDVVTAYGTLKVQAAELSEVVVGPPLAAAKETTPRPAPPAHAE